MLFAVSNVFALDKQSVFSNLKAEFDNLTSVHIVFSIGDNAFGELYAAKGGKMQLSLKNNIIISDGKTIWNVNPNSTVAISNYEKNDELSLESIFFEVIDELYPVSYSNVSITNTSDKYKLVLKPNSKSKFNDRLNSLTIYFNGQNYISRLLIDTPNGTSEYVVNLLEKNPKIAQSKFTYVPQKGIEVIDFR